MAKHSKLQGERSRLQADRKLQAERSRLQVNRKLQAERSRLQAAIAMHSQMQADSKLQAG